MTHLARSLLSLFPLLAPLAPAQEPAVAVPITSDAVARLQGRLVAELTAQCEAGAFPGASLALILPDGRELTACAGLADREAARPMTPEVRLLSGSVGKTYVSAAALQLAGARKLDLDDPLAKWLGAAAWYPRLPNGATVTLRQLLNHTSGIVEYYQLPAFIEVLRADRMRVWTPEETISWVLDTAPLFAAGEGWSYADTNYLLLGMVIEKAAQTRFYDYVQRHFLDPHGLSGTRPSDGPEIPGLAQGYSLLGPTFGFPERLLADGRCAVNPQFEWCGGGFANRPRDLARWARLLYTGEAFAGDYRAALLETVAAPDLGPGRRYGLGVIVSATPAGEMIGHDGFFPGHLTSMGWFPEPEIAAALQINTDGFRARGGRLHLYLAELVGTAAELLGTD